MTTTKIKGLCKGSFKYISQIFVVKEREMEIGLPTDVKHLAHIGSDGPAGNAPSWMKEYKAGSDMALASVGSIGGSRDPAWSSQDFEHTIRQQQSSAMLSNFPPGNMPNIITPNKQKRKTKSSSSSSSPQTSSARSSRSTKQKSRLRQSSDGNTRRSLGM